ncbi:hypothetical protein J6590_008793 [Homalodisca vitripennis]|nr:hypothetical protein J6590_008793 [Homalodisca vitripennis]
MLESSIPHPIRLVGIEFQNVEGMHVSLVDLTRLPESSLRGLTLTSAPISLKQLFTDVLDKEKAALRD